eukprot:6182255-Pleurochrysis_carterae.AAC.2
MPGAFQITRKPAKPYMHINVAEFQAMKVYLRRTTRICIKESNATKSQTQTVKKNKKSINKSSEMTAKSSPECKSQVQASKKTASSAVCIMKQQEKLKSEDPSQRKKEQQ